jgi:hypothetical protein
VKADVVDGSHTPPLPARPAAVVDSSAMNPLGTFLAAILGHLSLIGKFAAFFSTVLLLSGLATHGPVTLLSGFALFLFTISNGFWQDRHRTTVHLPYEVRHRWYKRFAWSRVSLAVMFFIAFLLVGCVAASQPFRRSIGFSF